MVTVFLDASNLRGSGSGKLARALVRELEGRHDGFSWVVWPPDDDWRRSVEDTTAHVLPARSGDEILGSRVIRRLYDAIVAAPLRAQRAGATVHLTLGDIPPPVSPLPTIVFVQQSGLAYDTDEYGDAGVWSPWRTALIQRLFSIGAKRARCVVVQTPVMARRVRERFGLASEQVRVISPPWEAVPPEAYAPTHADMERAGDRCRVLFLADGYRHKNHQVLTAVCEELRKRGLDSRYRIFVTLDPARRENDALLERLSRTGGIVVNLGKLSPEHVQSALVSSDVLLNPSLAESFGFPFLEAMARRVPVVAADRDFARWMCGPCAAYCDALSASSIVNALEQACSRSRDREAFARDAAAQLAKFPGSWSDTAAEWAKLIREIVATR